MDNDLHEFLRQKAFKERTSIKKIIETSLKKSGNYPKASKSK